MFLVFNLIGKFFFFKLICLKSNQKNKINYCFFVLFKRIPHVILTGVYIKIDKGFFLIDFFFKFISEQV